jgi:segregation and condensation protein B
MNHDEEREPQAAANEQALEAELALELGPPEVPPVEVATDVVAAEAAPAVGLPTDAGSAEAGPNDLGAGDLGAGELLDDESLLRALTALVYASPDPLTERRLQQLLERPALPRVRTALQALGERLTATGLPLELRQIAGGWQILTVADLGSVVQRLEKARKIEKMSGAALETLAVVAYRQPVTKAEIEAIRGVQAGPILRMLVDRSLVRVAGRADVPGHPLQYGTTRQFLDRFGLSSLDELPRDAELSKDAS